MKSKSSETAVSKSQILHWINSTLHSNESKIESLGNGLVYCLLINHYYPQALSKQKMIMFPRSPFDNKINLKRVQDALVTLNIKNITFDIYRVSQMTYIDNWQLINKFYKHFEQNQEDFAHNMDNNNFKEEKIQIHQINQFPRANQESAINKQFQFTKNISRAPQANNGLLTPMKGMKFFDENSKLRMQAAKLMDQVKTIVKSESQSDKIKVLNLKRILGLIQQESKQDTDFGELLSDCKKKQQIISID